MSVVGRNLMFYVTICKLVVSAYFRKWKHEMSFPNNKDILVPGIGIDGCGDV